MSIREDNSIEIHLLIERKDTKADIRKFLLGEWAKESVGKKYRYFVELLPDGKRIYLERPGRLNKGCDFVIYIEDLFLYKNGHDKPPSHQNFIDDLCNKKEQLPPEIWQNLIGSLEAVHSMTHHEIPLEYKNRINNLSPMSVEQIKLLCKWFFIEQDLTYWSGQGRDMLLEGIRSL